MQPKTLVSPFKISSENGSFLLKYKEQVFFELFAILQWNKRVCGELFGGSEELFRGSDELFGGSNQLFGAPIKGSDRLCKVVELSMQSCGQIL